MKQPLIAIIDYQLSNLFSVQQACKFFGANSVITSDKNVVLKADGLILPGVGAFGDAMANLHKLDLINPIKDRIKAKIPFMGVCLGLQLLFSKSEEFGNFQGLDVIKGSVKKFPEKNFKNEQIRIPQIGWNKIYQTPDHSWVKSPVKDISNQEYMYFVHSYYVIPEDESSILSLTNYAGFEYCSSVIKENVFAVQFHPEKSAEKGLSVYKNWLETTHK